MRTQFRIWNPKTRAFTYILVGADDWNQAIKIKDKKNKDIFEGDIIKNQWGEWVIIFQNGGWKLKQGFHIIEFDTLCPGETEIIGNIYESK